HRRQERRAWRGYGPQGARRTLCARHQAGLVEARAAGFQGGLAKYRGVHFAQRPVVPRRGAARARCARGRTRSGLLCDRRYGYREGVRRRPHHLRPCGGGMAGRTDGRRRGRRRDGRSLRPADGSLAGDAEARGGVAGIVDGAGPEGGNMTKNIRLTMAQALARFLTRQMTEIDGEKVPFFGGVWAIFGHGNVAGMGEALYQVRRDLPTYRSHNEQAMVHAAVGFAKANFRRRVMAATTSIGPGATNMVTGAALAHVNRLPVLLLPGDVFAARIPDPVLQQVEDFSDGTVSANDCFRPVSRYFDRITRPEQIVPALARAMAVLTDPADCGPVTLSLCQDVQAEAFDYPESFFEERLWLPRRQRPDENELQAAVEALRKAKAPLIISGGGTLYSGASAALEVLAGKSGIPVTETQGGKSSLPDGNPLNMGAIGVTGTSAANRLAEKADVVLAVGTRFQ